MIMVMFVRRLRPGVTFEQFKAAWLTEPNHFGQPVMVTHAQSLEDDREVVSYALLDVSTEDLAAALGNQQLLQGEADRHDRIDTVIESTTLRQMYDLGAEHDFTDLPARIEIGSPASLLSLLAGR